MGAIKIRYLIILLKKFGLKSETQISGAENVLTENL